MRNQNGTFCDCCFSTFSGEPGGEQGYIGDICTECGWEVDRVENCLEAMEYCDTWDDTVARDCTCHLNRPIWLSCGWSAPNHTTIREARQAYYLRSPEHRKELCIRAVIACTRFPDRGN